VRFKTYQIEYISFILHLIVDLVYSLGSINTFSDTFLVEAIYMFIDDATYQKLANAIRVLTIDAVNEANSGHSGMPMGMADVVTVLYAEFLKFNPIKPKWFDRDRFVLSAGHGSTLLYSLLYLLGYEDATLEQIKKFRQIDSKMAGHPEYGYLAGIETTTGPLGQGFANAIGMAIAERVLAARYTSYVDHYTYVVAGDGCLMEGVAQEAISLAGHLGLNKLIVLFDDNSVTIDGPTNISTSENIPARFEAAGWSVFNINGHSYAEIRAALYAARKSDKPSIICCKTIIGYGSAKAGAADAHGAVFSKEEISEIKQNLGCPDEAFYIPLEVLEKWRNIGVKHQSLYGSWQMNLEQNAPSELIDLINGKLLPDNLYEVIQQLKKDNLKNEPTRKSSGKVLEAIVPIMPSLFGGSADLASSTNTKVKSSHVFTRDNSKGNYLNYGVREHAMAAIMNGIALHGGFIPYGATFLTFSDYARPAIRLSALMQQKVIYIMTHDSIGLGEDGPTHQPVEHLASLRAMPNLRVFRPADMAEVAESWYLALNYDGPSLIALSRQDVAQVTNGGGVARGAYVVKGQETVNPKVSIIATGSEVGVAAEVSALLARSNVDNQLISMPCMELFEKQPQEYINSLLGNDSLKVVIEAGCKFGWDKYIGANGIFIGVDSFGLSGKAKDLYKHFGITVENIFEMIVRRINGN
jgi:transketolase